MKKKLSTKQILDRAAKQDERMFYWRFAKTRDEAKTTLFSFEIPDEEVLRINNSLIKMNQK